MSGVAGRRTPVGSQLPIIPRTDQVALKVVRGGSKDEEDEEPAAAETISPEARFLQQDDAEFWHLGPLPDGAVLRVDLANALHTYVTEKWSECAGLKKVTL